MIYGLFEINGQVFSSFELHFKEQYVDNKQKELYGKISDNYIERRSCRIKLGVDIINELNTIETSVEQRRVFLAYTDYPSDIKLTIL